MSQKLQASRRDFLRSATLLSAAAAVPVSTIVTGCTAESSEPVFGGEKAAAWKAMADSLKSPDIYTPDNPGQWANLIDTHMPTAAPLSVGVTVSTIHPQGAPDTRDGHYILCRFVESTDGEIFDFRMYTRLYESQIEDLLLVPTGYQGELRVYQYCTEHDLWMTTINRA